MMPLKMTEMWTTMGSTLASFMFMWAIIRQYCPYEVTRFLDKYTHNIMGYFYPYITISFHEFLGDRLKRSDAYAAVEAYLSVNTSKSAKRLKAEMGKDSCNLVLTMDEYERVTDEYKGIKVWWVCSKVMSSTRSMSYYQEQEKRFYKLNFHTKYRDIITGSYLEHVMKEGKEIRLRNRQRKLYTNSPGYKWPSYKQTMWSHIVFEHPATFETMAMESEKKREIIEDLVTFSKSKEFYERIGKAWKRGYLLYGPPGTGQRKKKGDKFSNDENDKLNSEVGLRKEVKEEGSSGSKVTLSGLLNFIDGIWSACGGERLIVFTTNYVEKLDPALIRRGRMDKHVELSYCTFEGFKVLANNYFKIETHPMFDTIKRLLSEVKITPADVAENLMPKSPMDDADKCLSNLIETLDTTKDEDLFSLRQSSPIKEGEKLKHDSHIKENGELHEDNESEQAMSQSR
ncbi:putative ATPase, AAA-type, core, AAA-type ATPase domain-containing protein [Lupinus albus]|uniref:Putative ATPase, AAA-type, core, AAA-type ATPase domain-containing protein n=1 Tax=Lupinus albus TaxID=3870 RepID=A0A6A4PJ09_LUPAL|nr:putative ATPase, AAA-type, core, AAA-type ATPase domain-containing protein [Lupinus albus]